MNQQDYFLNFDPYGELHFKVGEKVRFKDIEQYKTLGRTILTDEELKGPLVIEMITEDNRIRLLCNALSLRFVPIEWIEPV